MKTIRSATEAEVISEFLKNEYFRSEYHSDRKRFESIVFDGDLSNTFENTVRRELLFRRQRVIWTELPQDTKWFLVQLDPEDLNRVRIFPRGHWPKMTDASSLGLIDVANDIRKGRFRPETIEDVTLIHAIAYRIRRHAENSSILLIGMDEAKPLTILEGNHRAIAATLVDTGGLGSFKIYAGLSSQMIQCYWYQTTRDNFVRHARRRLCDVQPRMLKALKQRWATLRSRPAQGL